MSQLSKTVSTIVLRSLDPTYHHVEIIHDFWNVLWSESNIFHKNCIFSKLIEISTPVEISNDPDFFFFCIGWIMMKSVFLFFTVLSYDQN